MLGLRALFIGCLMYDFCCVYGMSSNALEFVQFLSRRHYLDGSRSVTSEDSEYIAQCMDNLAADDIFSSTVLHSFADNIAFVAAQSQRVELATQILFKSYEEDQNDDNWLFEEIRQKDGKITSDTIREALDRVYNCGG